MPNLSKLRKLGGAETVFVCKTGRTENSKCVKDFIDQFNFTFQDVPPDGNCFFHTLEKYYRKKGNMSANKGYKELRSTIVNYILENWEFYSDYGIVQEDILDFIEDGAWNLEVGDFVVPVAARALNIKLIVYDIKPAQKSPPTKKRIIRHIYPDEPPIPVEEVNILRINQGHFGLLIPKPAGANIVKNVANKVSKMTIANKKAVASRKKSASPKPVGRTVSRRKSPSPKPVVAPTTGYALRSRKPVATNVTVNKPAVAGPGRSRTPPKRRTAKKPLNREADELQAAIAASLATKKKENIRKAKILGNDFFNALETASFTNVGTTKLEKNNNNNNEFKYY
jgi:hypothetical protein